MAKAECQRVQRMGVSGAGDEAGWPQARHF